MTWRDESTLRGKLEAALDPVISGGATQAQIDRVVNRLLEMIPTEPKPLESITALKAAIRNEVKDCPSDPEVMRCRLHNIANIITCTSWSV